ncbi:uncharacterized protein (TIGR00299 family) protein [Methanohalophilus levihalophilus]|uniref:nickel pincer cofactor biosynthesis protein LarC n=1 Tax=Methanohalophilus levihalophilus TaxID=1431282 RepID=UPI001AE39FAE|nr:nickel pincer cofactor biosynthesis protein LarC [Methanohalophilus levihalophilus]MBP2029654.1 uncharacterized protein (TIGR00299 family) protein [Methanohalophilus levihalophilus]
MKALVFDAFSGASGDMILASLLALGADRNKITTTLENALGISVSVGKTSKKEIEATDVHIHVKEKEKTRCYAEIVETVKSMGLSDEVEENTLSVFAIIAEAEAKVHGVSLEELHFHEVGQNDAFADVIGSCMALQDLGFSCGDSIFCTALNVGGGMAKTAHGTLPVPAPATLEILKNRKLPFYGEGNRELLTPTGAALLAHFAKPIKTLPCGNLLEIGYGAGDADMETPNVLRIMLMDLDEEAACLSKDTIEVLETNVDDVTGEILGNLFDRLLSMGARDVVIIPATMKKNRPGYVIKVITSPESSALLAREIIKETGTLGVRVMPSRHRFKTERKFETINVQFNDLSSDVIVKIAQDLSGEILHISAEYEDCKIVARKTGLPLKDVIRKVEDEAWRKYM